MGKDDKDREGIKKDKEKKNARESITKIVGDT